MKEGVVEVGLEEGGEEVFSSVSVGVHFDEEVFFVGRGGIRSRGGSRGRGGGGGFAADGVVGEFGGFFVDGSDVFVEFGALLCEFDELCAFGSLGGGECEFVGEGEVESGAEEHASVFACDDVENVDGLGTRGEVFEGTFVPVESHGDVAVGSVFFDVAGEKLGETLVEEGEVREVVDDSMGGRIRRRRG